jgi:hypothetical protein
MAGLGPAIHVFVGTRWDSRKWPARRSPMPTRFNPVGEQVE